MLLVGAMRKKKGLPLSQTASLTMGTEETNLENNSDFFCVSLASVASGYISSEVVKSIHPKSSVTFNFSQKLISILF